MNKYQEALDRILNIEEYEEYNDNRPQGATAIYMDTLKAINQQCKELGWI